MQEHEGPVFQPRDRFRDRASGKRGRVLWKYFSRRHQMDYYLVRCEGEITCHLVAALEQKADQVVNIFPPSV